jgi:DNA-binding transcriptional LysR family regulator
LVGSVCAERFARLHRVHPGVAISPVEGDSNELLDAVRTGTIDVASVRLAADPRDAVETQIVVDEPLMLR